jgi:hypothetical protein
VKSASQMSAVMYSTRFYPSHEDGDSSAPSSQARSTREDAALYFHLEIVPTPSLSELIAL